MKTILLIFTLALFASVCNAQTTTDSLIIVNGKLVRVIPEVRYTFTTKEIKDIYQGLKAEKQQIKIQVDVFKAKLDTINANILKWEARMTTLGIPF